MPLEASNVNGVQAGKMRVERTDATLKVIDTDSAATLRLQYESAGVGILTNRGAITFRVNTSPEPSIMLVWNATPYQPKILAQDLMIGLVR